MFGWWMELMSKWEKELISVLVSWKEPSFMDDVLFWGLTILLYFFFGFSGLVDWELLMLSDLSIELNKYNTNPIINLKYHIIFYSYFLYLRSYDGWFYLSMHIKAFLKKISDSSMPERFDPIISKSQNPSIIKLQKGSMKQNALFLNHSIFKSRKDSESTIRYI
jgi:hypothetical protein